MGTESTLQYSQMHDSLFHQDPSVHHTDIYDDPYHPFPDYLTWSPDKLTPRSSPYVINQRAYINQPFDDADNAWHHRASFSSASDTTSVASTRVKQEDVFYPDADFHRQAAAVPYDLQLLQQSPTYQAVSPPRPGSSAFYPQSFQQQLHHQQLQQQHHQQQHQIHHQQHADHNRQSFASYSMTNATMHPADLSPTTVSPLSYQAWDHHPPPNPFDLDHDHHPMGMAPIDIDQAAVDMSVAVGEMMDMDGIVVVSGGMPVGLGDDSLPALDPNPAHPANSTIGLAEDTGEEDADGEEDWEAHSYQQQQQQQQHNQQQQQQLAAQQYIDSYQQPMDVQQQADSDMVRGKSDDDHARRPSTNRARAHSHQTDRQQDEAAGEGEGEGEERVGDGQDPGMGARRLVGANSHSHTTRTRTRAPPRKSPLSASSLSSISNASDDDPNAKADVEDEGDLSAPSEEDEDDEEDPDESQSSDDDYDDDNDPEFVLNTRSSRTRRGTTTTRRGASMTPASINESISYPGSVGPASYPSAGIFGEGRSLRPRAASARVRYTPYPGSAAGGYSDGFYDANGYPVDGSGVYVRGRYPSTGSGSLSPSLDGDSAGRTRTGGNSQHSQSRAHSVGGTRAPTTVPIPVPVPNLTKKSRGRRVPTMESLEDLRSAASGAGRKRQGPAGKGARMYLCEVDGCGKCFARGEHLKRHVRSIHTYEKPHKCMYPGCGKDFSRHDNLGQHMRVHKNYVQPDHDASSASTASPAPENTRRKA